MKCCALFLFVILFIPQASASEISCSLNDGMKADGKTSLEHHGVKHHFCCSGCLEQFKANPEKFAQFVDESGINEKQGAEAACSSVCGE